jgi:hypothetical protein
MSSIERATEMLIERSVETAADRDLREDATRIRARDRARSDMMLRDLCSMIDQIQELQKRESCSREMSGSLTSGGIELDDAVRERISELVDQIIETQETVEIEEEMSA